MRVIKFCLAPVVLDNLASNVFFSFVTKKETLTVLAANKYSESKVVSSTMAYYRY